MPGTDVGRRLLTAMGAPLLRAWAGSLRFHEAGRARVTSAFERGPVITVFWHNRFLMLPFIYPNDRRIGVLISPSADGDIIAATIEALGRDTIRGSSRRDAGPAFDALTNWLAEGRDVGIAVDGPLGPVYEPKTGAIRLSQHTGAPIVPLVYTTDRGLALPTWDRFWLPAPGACAAFVWGEPWVVPPDLAVDTARTALRSRMLSALREACACTGGSPC